VYTPPFGTLAEPEKQACAPDRRRWDRGELIARMSGIDRHT
jgi:hypothetical protein